MKTIRLVALMALTASGLSCSGGSSGDYSDSSYGARRYSGFGFRAGVVATVNESGTPYEDGPTAGLCHAGAIGRNLLYEVSADGQVEVARPSNCKTYCPACARICPSVAIIFPKYKSGPICGEAPPPAATSGEKVKVNLKELLTGDVHEMLRRRSRQSVGKPGCACGKDAPEDLEIPPEAMEAIRQRLEDAGPEGPDAPAQREPEGCPRRTDN